MASGKQEDWLYKNVKDLRKRLQDTERSLQNLHTLDERYLCVHKSSSVIKTRIYKIVRFKNNFFLKTTLSVALAISLPPANEFWGR